MGRRHDDIFILGQESLSESAGLKDGSERHGSDTSELTGTPAPHRHPLRWPLFAALLGASTASLAAVLLLGDLGGAQPVPSSAAHPSADQTQPFSGRLVVRHTATVPARHLHAAPQARPFPQLGRQPAKERPARDEAREPTSNQAPATPPLDTPIAAPAPTPPPQPLGDPPATPSRPRASRGGSGRSFEFSFER